MGFKCGIVGLPNVGKSTLFNSLSSAKAEAANYPFCTIEPNVGMIPVPDPRLAKLSELVNPQNELPAVVKIVDIAGLVRGASKGEGLGNKFLGNIRECDAILHVLRCFEDGNVIHVETTVDPIRDKEIIDTELQFKDLEALEKLHDKTVKMAKGGNKEPLKDAAVIQEFIDHISQGQNARSLELEPEKREIVSELGLLTDKKVLYVCNVDEAALENNGNEFTAAVQKMADSEGSGVMMICAKFEEDLIAIEEPEEKAEFLETFGLEEPGLNVLIREAYKLLDLQTYFTAGEKEVRAWTIAEGTKAPQAAGVIHTDFEKGFIRAQVISYGDYISCGSEAAARDAGKLRVEGKEYTVADGDVMHFLFNV